MVNPSAIRVEACSLCQLHCPLCPASRGETDAVIGRGRLRFADFERLIRRNPQILAVELANFGEVFLNPDLPRILAFAHERGVATSIDEGANLNDASTEALEALVKYQVAQVRCAVDGVTRSSYRQYRAGGDLAKVLANIQEINRFKERYRSSRPRLVLQFVVFAHNEEEIERAALMARVLRMELQLKLNFFPDSLPVKNRERVKKHLGYADRNEYLEKARRHYSRHQCHEMWIWPQVNWDGRILGCSRNIWGAYPGNAFSADLVEGLNSSAMESARAVLMGLRPLDPDMPCARCSVYRSLADHGDWITPDEIAQAADALDSLYAPR